MLQVHLSLDLLLLAMLALAVRAQSRRLPAERAHELAQPPVDGLLIQRLVLAGAKHEGKR